MKVGKSVFLVSFSVMNVSAKDYICQSGQIMGAADGEGNVAAVEEDIIRNMPLAKIPISENICCVDVS